jgi:predicted DNA binding protein
MLIVEVRTDSPVLEEALAHAPGATVSYEELYPGDFTFLFWVEGGDVTAFEKGLTADPTVTDVVQLTETRTRRLYRVTVVDGGSVTTAPVWPELNISLLDLTGTHRGWDLRMRISDRDALGRYREACETRNIEFRFEAIYEEREGRTKATTRLTDIQRETLATARELGYYEIPREASLTDVANQCDVSSQAVSERLRRGTASLVDAVL